MTDLAQGQAGTWYVIHDAAGKNQLRTITAYNATTKVATLDTAPDATSEFVIV